MQLSHLITCMKTLVPAKATGLDGISPKILKSAADVVGPYLLQIIKISISNGQCLDILFVAKLKPIHKSGLKTNPYNYRPISVLPVVSKFIEKHVTKRLFAFLNKYQLLISLSWV